MNVHFAYKVHKTSDLEKHLNHFLEKLQRRLQAFRPELVHLKGTVDQSTPREGFIVSLNLRLPSGQMAAQETASTALAAFKAASEALILQTNKHKELLRSTHKWKRRRTAPSARREPVQVPFEGTLAALPPPTVSSDDIRSYINVNLSRLQRFVQREILFREAAEQVGPDFPSEEEIVDEAVARALGDGMEKPDRLALEPWLYRLAINAMNDLSSHDYESSDSIPLEVSRRRPNVRASDEPELQFHQPDESLTGENVVADRRLATPEDIASSDEMVALVGYALGGLKRADREAFLLHGIEGFSVEEIVDITERSAEDIRNSIAAAREQLRRSPPIAGRFKGRKIETGNAQRVSKAAARA